MGLHASASAPTLRDDNVLKVGDEVTTNGGPDASVGPWRGMGNGIVIGCGAKRGYLAIQFHSTYEVFDIKAKNLRKVA